MEHHEQPMNQEILTGAAHGEKPADTRALFSHMQEKMEQGIDPESLKMEDAIAWANAVDQVFTELENDPEFEQWLDRLTAHFEQDPQFQERVAHDKQAFLAMVREQYHSQEESASPS